MSTEYAPDAIYNLFNLTKSKLPDLHLLLGGIMGDINHKYGYHLPRAILADNDYSVVEPDDRQGDPWACSALDITPPTPDGMHFLTRNLRNAVESNDPRLLPIREFAGTLDSVNVFGYDVRSKRLVGSQFDSGHLYHVHLSIFRRYANATDVLADVADVLAGIPIKKENVVSDMTVAQVSHIVAECARAMVTGENHGQWTEKDHPIIVGAVSDLRKRIETLESATTPAKAKG